MEMSNREIASMYRNAKYPKMQITILADLNCTTPDVIREILRSEGIDAPKKKYKKRKKKEEKEMAAVIEEPARQSLPTSVSSLIFKIIDELEQIIQEASREYKELTSFMEGVANE